MYHSAFMVQFLQPEWLDSAPSTNTRLRERLARGEPLASGYVLATREQTAGRGRFDRRWVSAPGRDLAFSFVVRTAAPAHRLASLPMAAALGVADALDRFGLRARTKWPNDVLVGTRKICGILAEDAGACGADGRVLVVGIGLNVNLSASEAARIDRPATSIAMETGRAASLETVLGAVLPAIAARIGRWEAGGFAALRADWTARTALLGQAVAIHDGDGANRTGMLDGFGPDGELLLRGGDGTVAAVWSGDVSLRPADGPG